VLLPLDPLPGGDGRVLRSVSANGPADGLWRTRACGKLAPVKPFPDLARHATKERAMDVGMMMVFASYGWTIAPTLACGRRKSGWLDRRRSGLDCVWSAEHHFNEYSFVPDNSS